MKQRLKTSGTKPLDLALRRIQVWKTRPAGQSSSALAAHELSSGSVLMPLWAMRDFCRVNLIAVCILKLVKRHRDSSLPKLKPRSFPVHDSNGTSGCRTLLATRQLL
jgi:hypothetical protein